MTVDEVAEHVDSKILVILDGYLRTTLEARPIPGVSEDALTVRVGLDVSTLPDRQQVDTLPRVDVWSTGATTDNDVLDAANTEASWTVSATVNYDGADYSAAGRSAARLAMMAAGVLEQYLPDPNGALGVIWDVRLVRPIADLTAPMSDERPATVRASVEITIHTRATYGFSPTYGQPELAPFVGVIEPLANATVMVDATSLGSAEPLRSTAASITAAQLAGGTYLILDVTAVASWPVTSPWSVYLSRHNVAVSGTLAGSDPRVAIASYSVQDNDRWVVTVTDATTLRTLTWALTWTVV